MNDAITITLTIVSMVASLVVGVRAYWQQKKIKNIETEAPYQLSTRHADLFIRAILLVAGLVSILMIFWRHKG